MFVKTVLSGRGYKKMVSKCRVGVLMVGLGLVLCLCFLVKPGGVVQVIPALRCADKCGGDSRVVTEGVLDIVIQDWV